MSSSGRSEPIDLQRGLPTTAADVEALERNVPGALPYDAYLRFLARFPAPTYEELKARGITEGPPFRLD